MDDTPIQFIQELRSGIWKKRAGQIALAVILAEACLRFLNALTWFLIIPAISAMLEGHTESVLFQSRHPFPWQSLFGNVLDFIVALVFVFYLNRWIRGKPTEHSSGAPEQSIIPTSGAPGTTYTIVGDSVSPTEQPGRE
jgi:large-conductance mechanosensitive channel